MAARLSRCTHERPGSARGKSARGLRKENPGDLSIHRRFNKCLSAFLKQPEDSTLLCWEQRDGVGTCQPRSLHRLRQHRSGGFGPSSQGKAGLGQWVHADCLPLLCQGPECGGGRKARNASAGFSAHFLLFELQFVAPVRVVGALPTTGAWHIASPCCLQVGQKQNKLMG